MRNEGHPRHLLVGYEGGEAAEGAARAALDMHRRFGAAVEFVHVVDLPRPEDVAGRPDRVAETGAEIEAAAFDHVAAELEALAADCGSDLALRDRLLVAVGHPARVIVERAAEVGADLIVMGPHRRRGVFDFGSTARAILGKAPCDVWMQPRAQRAVERILVPLDLSEESLAALHIASSMAAALGARVTALHCFPPPDLAYAASPGYPVAGPTYAVEDVRKLARQEFEEAVAGFDWEGVEHDQRFSEGRPADVILELSAGYDLIAMGSHGRTGLAAAVLGNVAYAVLKQSEVPVLCIRHPMRDWLLG